MKAGVKLREPHKPHRHPAQSRYGERIVNGQSQAHLAEQRVIKAVLDLHKQGLTLRQIARFLDQIGISTKCKGKTWHPEMIARIIDKNKSHCTEIACQVLVGRKSM